MVHDGGWLMSGGASQTTLEYKPTGKHKVSRADVGRTCDVEGFLQATSSIPATCFGMGERLFWHTTFFRGLPIMAYVLISVVP